MKGELMMKLLADAINSYLSAEHNIQRLLTESKELMDNVNVYRLNSEDAQQYHTLYQAIQGLEEAHNSIVDLSKEVQLEGYLQKNEWDRYELCGRELTSGSSVDVWRDDPEMKEGGYYVQSRIEHRGDDYYCVAMPYIKLEGLKARYRALP
ncbi:DUF5348 domain-containing protein [Sporosarcina sp. FSL K6-1508]|uniref:DUF5348 domain-containing protein n=1 Tax=Sporosarcina sp. FSL K6-1508 TaxID=2921553 RepID=UPI0030FA1B8C